MPRARKPKTARRPRGSGSIFHSAKRNLWVGRVPVGKLASGATRYREVTAATQAELLAKMRQVQPPGPTATVKEWGLRWLDSLDGRPSTVAIYTHSVMRYINPTLGHKLLAALDPPSIRHAVRQWGDALGANTVRQTLTHLRICLGEAVRQGVLATNPASLVKLPKFDRKPMTPFTPAELAAIIAEAQKRPNTRFIVLLAATGCRQGEALALEVSDFDAASGMVSITKTFNHKHGVGPPKTSNGRRTIRAPQAAALAIRAAIGSRSTGRIFRTSGGKTPCRSMIHLAWRRLLKRAGLPYRNLHQLRHSFATATLAAGFPVADVARYLGDRPETVFANYVHPSGADPADLIDRLISGR